MSRKHNGNNRHQPPQAEASRPPLYIDSSRVSGCVSQGSSVYVPKEAVVGSPSRGHAFIAGFTGKGGVRYFNANQIGSNDQKFVFRIGREQDASRYQGQV
ncbi:MAG: hypothetical protein KKD18_04320 [Nanoarchaeota archaeon]|nr:hypothetical protein [Nanoarchaeota archaeon]